MPETAYRIYAGYAGTRRLHVPKVTPAPIVEDSPPRRIPDPFDTLLIEALDAPLQGETIAVAYQHKEARLREVFATVSAVDARSLHARLSTPQPDDTVAERFARLAADRRARLLAFLADARRRSARRP